MENTKTIYYEKQKFTQWWIWLIISIGVGIFIYGMYKQIVLGDSFGNKPMDTNQLIISFTTIVFAVLLFAVFRLETKITEDGVEVRLFPFHIRFKHFNWNEISKCYVRKYSPVSEYGGWGLRWGIFGNGKAYSISGNVGLQLEFKNGKKLLIGTQKGEEIKTILEKINLSLEIE